MSMSSRPSWRYHPQQAKDSGNVIASCQSSSSSSSDGVFSDMSKQRMPSSSNARRVLRNLSNNTNTRTPSNGKGNLKETALSPRSAQSPLAMVDASSKSKRYNPATGTDTGTGMVSLVRRLMDTKRSGNPNTTLFVPANLIANDLKKAPIKNGVNSKISKFVNKISAPKNRNHPLPITDGADAKSGGRRRLCQVVEGESDLRKQNEILVAEIQELRSLMSAKDSQIQELESSQVMLQQLCSEQRREIRRLKSEGCVDDQVTEIIDKQGNELKQARQVIPSLQKQVTSLTQQLHYLAQGLAEVKADKEEMKAYFDARIATPKTPKLKRETENYMGFGESEPSTPTSAVDDLILQDMNPCLTPCYGRTKSQEYDQISYGVSDEEQLAEALQNLVFDHECKPNVLHF